MKGGLTQIAQLLCPPYCVICGILLPVGQWGESCCVSCRKDIPYIKEHTCRICGAGNTQEEICFTCHQKKPVFDQAIAAFPYTCIAKAVERFKFQGAGHDGEALGRLMGQFLLEYHAHWRTEVDMMTEVPLHPKKVRERGYNQVELLCKELSLVTEIPYEKGLLIRTKYTTPQSALKAAQRKVNLQGVFQAKDCQEQRILLIDDIFTTGSTVTECSRALYRAGAKEVRVFCLSQA